MVGEDAQDQNGKGIKEGLNKTNKLTLAGYPSGYSDTSYSDAKSQFAHGNNVKRSIITAALLNLCGQSGTEEFLLERGGGGAEIQTVPKDVLFQSHLCYFESLLHVTLRQRIVGISSNSLLLVSVLIKWF